MYVVRPWAGCRPGKGVIKSERAKRSLEHGPHCEGQKYPLIESVCPQCSAVTHREQVPPPFGIYSPSCPCLATGLTYQRLH